MCEHEEVCAAQKPVKGKERDEETRERKKQSEELVVDLQPLIYHGALRQLSGIVIDAISASRSTRTKAKMSEPFPYNEAGLDDICTSTARGRELLDKLVVNRPPSSFTASGVYY